MHSWLKNPINLELYNIFPKGSLLWSFVSSSLPFVCRNCFVFTLSKVSCSRRVHFNKESFYTTNLLNLFKSCTLLTKKASLTFCRNILAIPYPFVRSHIPVMQFLNHNISSAAQPLSLSLTICLSTPCDWIRPSRRLGASVLPVPAELRTSSGGADEVFLLLWSMKKMTVDLKICWWLHLKQQFLWI